MLSGRTLRFQKCASIRQLSRSYSPAVLIWQAGVAQGIEAA